MAKQIPAIAPAAYSGDICGTCCRRADQPYRTHDAHGKTVNGCVANFHTGHLLMQHSQWHNRPEAKKIRSETAKFYRS